MKIDRVSANIRFSQDIQGAWKSVELGAEAILDNRDNWQQAQSKLYQELAGQLRTLWGNSSGNQPKEH